MSTLNETPGANRLHIGVFGRTNSGKSSFINAFTGQQVSIVADVAGTTTDPVAKPMEIQPLGACVIIDTAGFDDSSALGKSRVEKTKQAAEKSDIGVILFSDEDMTKELEWYQLFQKKNTPVLPVISKSDSRSKEDIQALSAAIQEKTGVLPLVVSSATGEGMDMVREQLARRIPESFDARTITGGLVGESDTVLLVMPQDIQAPKGRLILPQVQTIRELLDKKCLVMSVTTDKMTEGLAALAKPPKLIITDSQVFGYVYEQKPKESMLTSFSVLFAAYKGDLPYYIEGARAIDSLNENSRVLIAECCTHAPLAEDIGRVKLPRMLRKRFGEGLQVDMKSGTDFPQDLSGYDLIIQCGACMFNRKYVLSRIDRAKAQHIPMTNYGVTIAHLTGILDKITFV
ncbi:MAG: [FeFe] hydrogenase H-cluster maturation GTPase HydF [Lachnospiraceae bacterium]|nr:[FeFe] hydrogenase H-cluster maturation GTPase HydF [Lachnospiraceae bacterium]